MNSTTRWWHDRTPEGVGSRRLDELLQIVRGVTYKKEQARSQAAEGFIPILRATNINDGWHLILISCTYPKGLFELSSIFTLETSCWRIKR
jgi:hypothetical protein